MFFFLFFGFFFVINVFLFTYPLKKKKRKKQRKPARIERRGIQICAARSGEAIRKNKTAL